MGHWRWWDRAHDWPPVARALRPWAALLALAMLAGCATAPQAGPNDPFEQTNRAVFAFNRGFNSRITLPVAFVYVNYLPAPIRRGLHNALENAESPVIFANDVLQGRLSRAGQTLGRFVLNSTVGLGGLVDLAASAGMPRHEADFGQTLALYGVPAGPFLVLPLIGPSTPRDILGTGLDLAANPLFYVPADWSLLGHAGTVVGIHAIAPFETNAGSIVLRRQLARGSVDPYATMRSVYRQQREQAIGAGRPPPMPHEDD